MINLGAQPFMISALGFDMPDLGSSLHHFLNTNIFSFFLIKKFVVGVLEICRTTDRRYTKQLATYTPLVFGFQASIRKHQDVETPIVCHILDVTREVTVGVANIEVIEKFLSPEWIQQFKHTIHSAPLLMVDANLSPPTLEVACQRTFKTSL
ncbi:hypothetical protein Goshw_011850 [Gossypium schwendimanii]|uniref:Uncharacterized protein n=1 Tax=Gossypium schwendimanii TaxID=34291 RepID=A0A7J9LV91_GOSSC|nr:hypothetical protein [Gossypium schwendimanii]